MKISEKYYIPVILKFWVCHAFAFLWFLFSIYLSLPWINDLSNIIGFVPSILIIAGIAYFPGYLNAFMVVSLLLDKQPKLKIHNSTKPLSILISCKNEENGIADTLKYISQQDYEGEIKVIVIDNASTDETAIRALQAGQDFKLNLKVICEERPGKNFALNHALSIVDTSLVITLDADTLLTRSAVRLLVCRLLSAPTEICAVAGAVLVRNSRKNFWTKIQEWDYFLGIASIKRLQGFYQGTLVAQGAFSLYKRDALLKIGGWDDAIGEDIVLTWKMLQNNCKVYFEPLAVAFTDVPESFVHFVRQRSRWARGMIEAFKQVKPWNQPTVFARYLTGTNLFFPFSDLVYTFVWIPGLILAFFGHYYIVGATFIFVLPLALITNYVMYHYQRKVFQSLGLKIRKNLLGFFAYVLTYQIFMSPISVWGYTQEFLQLKRVWK
ncbi:glycosyltransferase family 2 protein [Bacillus benzoevorans]|uniref:Biofilm PGA synthesis N-glycosyltransferase PgaC n=1 Tax=Bacillus benzoevorans TaxID=1456 RepID=A0A7X0LYX6_9BACI|nr:glycosyltransferase [Bacillus benzoevorans]MBB6447899.1 biofilm PGA synthesis N-glycosyltransferase PgaC [Bacillus benzoevorans]